MSRTISFKTTFALASVSAFAALAPALAQEEGAAEEKPAATEESAEAAPAKAGKVFFPLMRCKRAEGKVMVLKPRTTEWVDAVEGRYYPFGWEFIRNMFLPHAAVITMERFLDRKLLFLLLTGLGACGPVQWLWKKWKGCGFAADGEISLPAMAGYLLVLWGSLLLLVNNTYNPFIYFRF